MPTLSRPTRARTTKSSPKRLATTRTTVRTVMAPAPWTCTAETNLAAVAMLMWDRDCGIIPVTDADGVLLGVVTDRDICMAVATRHQRAEEIAAADVMSGPVVTCRPETTVTSALRTMADAQIRRLPVVDADDRLVGICSINDCITAATAPEEVLTTLRAIGAHRLAAVAA